jgi:hypothetical protein
MKYLTLFALVTIFGIGCSEESNNEDLKNTATFPIDAALGLTLGEVVDWDSDKRFTKSKNSSNEYNYWPENHKMFPFHEYEAKRNPDTNQVVRIIGFYFHKEGAPLSSAMEAKRKYLEHLRDMYGWFTPQRPVLYAKQYNFKDGRVHQVMMKTLLDGNSFLVKYSVEK